MDTIKFVVEDYIDEEFGFQFPTINIYINERNLIDLVQLVERRDEDPAQAGKPLPQSYVGLHPGYYREFVQEYLGQQKRGFSILLICTCLNDICNCIRGRITINPDTVVWDDLKSPWLSSKSPNPWVDFEEAEKMGWYPVDYSALGPFVFNRQQYLDAVNMLVVK